MTTETPLSRSLGGWVSRMHGFTELLTSLFRDQHRQAGRVQRQKPYKK